MEVTLEVFFDSLGAKYKSFVSLPDHDATIDDLEMTRPKQRAGCRKARARQDTLLLQYKRRNRPRIEARDECCL